TGFRLSGWKVRKTLHLSTHESLPVFFERNIVVNVEAIRALACIGGMLMPDDHVLKINLALQCVGHAGEFVVAPEGLVFRIVDVTEALEIFPAHDGQRI